MVGRQLQELLVQSRQFLHPPRAAGVSDSQLLDRFLTRRDEAAFELLVWRHGPMVLSLCGRVLNDSHDAEDAFQATFLVLARKAGTIGKRESVGGWLYKVAHRIALRARERAAKRALHERAAGARAVAAACREPQDDLAWRDLRPVLDAEVMRLPEKYRVAFVLCHLQGKTNEEAAAVLGCPKGTVLSRLNRARERLRQRLADRGVVLSAGPFVALLTQHAGTLAEVSPVLVNATVQMMALLMLGKAAAGVISASVAGLTEEAVEELSIGKLRYAAAVVLLLLGSGAGVFAYSAWAGESARTRPPGACHSSPPAGSPKVCSLAGEPDGP